MKKICIIWSVIIISIISSVIYIILGQNKIYNIEFTKIKEIDNAEELLQYCQNNDVANYPCYEIMYNDLNKYGIFLDDEYRDKNIVICIGKEITRIKYRKKDSFWSGRNIIIPDVEMKKAIKDRVYIYSVKYPSTSRFTINGF